METAGVTQSTLSVGVVEDMSVESAVPFDASVTEEPILATPPNTMTVRIGDMVHMNGLLYDVAGVYTWRAMSPSYNWVSMLNSHLAGASFLAEEVGVYHVYIDTGSGPVDIAVNVSK